ncbi:MAG: hypothetical protein HUJ70_02030 [Pseudobutyrivibrio sp.]|nr:hypothetical protein [Pseudobutyrivibrio sp.]
MYTFNSLGEYVAKLYEKIKSNYVKDHKKQEEEFTVEDGNAVNKLLVDAYAKEVMEEKPCIDPDMVLRAYGNQLKSLKKLTAQNCQSVTNSTMEKRIDKHKNAAKSFAMAMAKNCGYVEGKDEAIKLQADRKELQILNYLSAEDRKSYLDAVKNDELNKRYEYQFKAIGNMLKACKDEFDFILPDEDLIKKFPNIAGHCMLINEADMMLKKIADDKPASINAKSIEEYRNKVGNLMAYAASYQNRMSMMADPFYPHINLEVLFDTDPEKLSEINQNIIEKLGDVPLDKDNNAIYTVYDDHKTFETERDKAGVVAEGAYLNKICSDENILKLPGIIAGSVTTLAEQKVTSKLGGELNDIYRNVLFLNKEGKNIDMTGSTLTEKLREDKEFYIVDRDGKNRPIPARLEEKDDRFNFLIGDQDFAYYDKTLKEPTMDFSSKLWNGVVRTASLGFARSDARKAYKAEKKRIDHIRALSHGEYPEQVKKAFAHIKSRNAELDKNRLSRTRAVDGLLKGMKYIPVENTKAFDDALINLMVNMGLNAKRSDFHTTMQELLGVFAPGFSEATAINDFRKRPQIREFAWKLRTEKNNEELIKKLQSGNKNKAKEAMTEISEKLVNEFNTKEPWNKPVSEDYNKFAEEQAAQIKADKEAEIDKAEQENKLPNYVHKDDKYWDTVNSFFGSKLKPRLDWMSETSDKNIYSMNDFVKLKEEEIDLKECVVEGLDEETFASLGMILSLGAPKLAKGNDKDARLLDTLTFEHLVLTGQAPKNFGMLVGPVVAPTRKALIKNLDRFNLDGSDKMARDLAGALKVYAKHVGSYDWNDGKYAAVTAVADRVLKFIKENKLMHVVKSYGLTDDELTRIQTANAIGKTLKDAAQATERLRDGEMGIKMSENDCKECIAKIMRYKAVMADIEANDNIAQMNMNSKGKPITRLFDNKANYPFMAINLKADKSQAASFGLRMLPESKRLKLAKKGPKAVIKALNDKSLYEKMIAARMNPGKEQDKYMKTSDDLSKLEKILTESKKQNRFYLEGIAKYYRACKRKDNIEGIIALSQMSDKELLKKNRECLEAVAENKKIAKSKPAKQVQKVDGQAKAEGAKNNRKEITDAQMKSIFGNDYKAVLDKVKAKKNIINVPKNDEVADNKLAKSENNINLQKKDDAKNNEQAKIENKNNVSDIRKIMKQDKEAIGKKRANSFSLK